MIIVRVLEELHCKFGVVLISVLAVDVLESFNPV
jgi:hypothetical protein